MQRGVIAGIVAACVALAIALALLAWFLIHDEQAPARVVLASSRRIDAAPPSVLSASAPASLAPVQQQRTSASNEPVSARLVAELQASTDWRAFALNAASRPEEGGYFYATLVTNWCGMPIAANSQYVQSSIATAVAKDATISAKQIEMTGRLQRVCASFAPGETGDLYRDLQRRVADARDPLMNARKVARAAAMSSDPKPIETAVRDMISSGDPLVAFDGPLLAKIMNGSAGPEARGVIWFEGEPYGPDEPAKSATMQLAMAAAACSSGAPCEHDIYMTIGCLGGQVCTTSRRDYLHNQFVTMAGLSEAEFEAGLRLGDRLLDAMRSKSTASFLKPP